MEGICIDDILEAHKRIFKLIHRTPVITSQTLNEAAGCQIFFKAENLQKTGSFKARGACNAVFRAKELTPNCAGIVTHSSGNHGQAVAYASKCAGLACSVVVPKGTLQVKCDAITGYGAQLVFSENSPSARVDACAKIASETGKLIVHPYDDYLVMAGQGTIALELLQEIPDLDAILVPISGGGMTAGIAVAAKALQPSCRVFPVEPLGKGLQMCLEKKQRLWPNPPQFLTTVADSIRLQQVGHLTFPLLCEFAESKVFSVNDDQMIEGMRLAFERMKMVVESASGAAVYVALNSLSEVEPPLQKVGVILCGGNVDLDTLPWLK